MHNKHPHLAHPKYRPDIDGLRAVAILTVVLFHAFPAQIKGGFIGVDIFFVISGFLISTIIFSSLERDRFSLVEFYVRRIRRIFPALILVMLASLVYGWFAFFADEYKQLGKHIASGAGFVSNFTLWLESGYFDNAAESKPMLHLWSLAIEEQFYIFWPLLLAFVWKRQWSFLRITSLIAAVSFTANIYLVNRYPTAAFYLPIARFWELMTGGALAYVVLHRPNLISQYKNGQSVIGFILILTGFLLLNKYRDFPGWWALLPALGAFFVISAGPGAWLNEKLLSNKVMVWAGLISYPLYLWHWALLSFARIVEGAPWKFRLAVVLASIVLAWLTYRFVEQPFRLGAHGKGKALSLSALMAFAGLAGYMCFYQDGLAQRSAGKIIDTNRFDRPYKQGCNALTGENYGDDWCSIGAGSMPGPSTVVIGDSFANAYSPMFAAYAKNRPGFSYVQFARGLCPSLLGYGPEYCVRITDRAYDFIKQNDHIKTVVLAANWPVYFPGNDTFHLVKHSESAGAFRAAFEKTILAYSALGKRVVILLAPPVGSTPRSCLNRPMRLTDYKNCNLSREFAARNDGNYREYIIPILAKENIPYFDPFKFFCDEKVCKITDGNKIYSADGFHLSIFGGEYLAATGEKELDDLLRR